MKAEAALVAGGFSAALTRRERRRLAGAAGGCIQCDKLLATLPAPADVPSYFTESSLRMQEQNAVQTAALTNGLDGLIASLRAPMPPPSPGPSPPPLPPPPSPPPPSPSPPPSTEKVEIALTVPGQVSDYTPAVKMNLQQTIATAAGVAKSLVTVDVFVAAARRVRQLAAGGSVNLIITIAVPASRSAPLVQSALAASGTLGTTNAVSRALNSALGGTSRVTVENMPTIQAVRQPSPPPSPSPPSSCNPADATWVEATISVTATVYAEELSWTLSCDGMCDSDTIVTRPGDMYIPDTSAMYMQETVAYQGSHRVPPGRECTLSMSDSYGDGWNGASWKAPGLLGPGVSYSIETGASKTETFWTPFAAKPIASPSPPPPASPSPSPPLPCWPEDNTWVESTIDGSRGTSESEVSWTLSCVGMCDDIVMGDMSMPVPMPWPMGDGASMPGPMGGMGGMPGPMGGMPPGGMGSMAGMGGGRMRRLTGAAQTGEEACENMGFDQSACDAVGCCHYDDGLCWSAVGPDLCSSGGGGGGGGGGGHRVPPGAMCTLTMADSYGDGWNGASWEAPGWLGPGVSYSVAPGRASQVETFFAPLVAMSTPSPSPFPAQMICSACQGAVDENNCPTDWAGQMPYVNMAVMPGCAETTIDACKNGGGDAALCLIADQIVEKLGWDQPQKFDFGQLTGCVPRSALPCSALPSGLTLRTFFIHNGAPKAHGPMHGCSNVRLHLGFAGTRTSRACSPPRPPTLVPTVSRRRRC